MWQYPHANAAGIAAKTSVTALRRRWSDDTDTEAKPRFPFQSQVKTPRDTGPSGKLSAAEIGIANHAFLQLISLEHAGTAAGLQVEARRLELEGALTAKEIASIDLAAIGAFWQSELGAEILAQRSNVQRELEFTMRLSVAESIAGLESAAASDSEEFVVVQGAADLVVLLPSEIWLVDFKNDRVTEVDLALKIKEYEPQLRLYSVALSRIYRRPVTRSYLHFIALRRSASVG
jgi:ATP-dependent helicase/nuclease subunit A